MEGEEKKKQISWYLFLSRAGNGSPIQYPYLGRGDWRATVRGFTEEMDMTELPNNKRTKNISVNITVICTGKQEKWLWLTSFCVEACEASQQEDVTEHYRDGASYSPLVHSVSCSDLLWKPRVRANPQAMTLAGLDLRPHSPSPTSQWSTPLHYHRSSHLKDLTCLETQSAASWTLNDFLPSHFRSNIFQ